MRGEFLVVASNNRVQFKLTIRRNLTILKGNSATGKTTLLDLVAAYDELGSSSGVIVRCDVPCHVLSGKDWVRDLTGYSSCIIFIDEDSAFMRSYEFASMAKASDNYYVLVARESLHQLPYSVDEIYGLKNSNRSTTKYPVYSRVYASTYRIYSHSTFEGERPELVIVEDTNSGYEFFSTLCLKNGIPCISARGKSNVYSAALHSDASKILIIADGAAFGPEMEAVHALGRFKEIELFLPESFEWLVLRSGLFEDNETRKMLERPANYIDSERFFSWEQFFTHELIEKTAHSYLAYQKSSLNDAYLEDRSVAAIVKGMPDLGIEAPK